jgi:excinuclease UvrABC nuclease subunit
VTIKEKLSDQVVLRIDDSVQWKFGQAFLVPDEPGVYLFHDLRGTVYVGRTSNLRRRFNEHFWRTSNPLLAMALARPVGNLYFSWCIVGIDEQAEVESELIKYFQPICNRQGK